MSGHTEKQQYSDFRINICQNWNRCVLSANDGSPNVEWQILFSSGSSFSPTTAWGSHVFYGSCGFDFSGSDRETLKRPPFALFLSLRLRPGVLEERRPACSCNAAELRAEGWVGGTGGVSARGSGGEGGGGEGRGQPRERGWDRVDEWGRKKNTCWDRCCDTFCKKEKRKKERKQKEIKSIAVTINQLLNNYFEATFKLFCISSLGKCSNGQLWAF